jgi:cell division protein FtsQ
MKPQHQADWPTLYQAVQDSPVRVTEIDWRQPSNLILQTELGSVHLGPFSGKFSAQLAALDQMRQLPDQLNGQQFAYIDLRNPKAPTLQMMTKD